MADIRTTNVSARRAAECLLRSSGGRLVYLRMPAPVAVPTIDDELGLNAPEFQDAELSPVVFRKARPGIKGDGERWELVVSAEAIDDVLGDSGASDASTLFSTAAGVLVDGNLMEVEGVSSSDMDGAPYVYRLLLRMPQAKTI